MPAYALEGVIPVVHPGAFVHPTAVLIGDVIVANGCYVGPSASLRGDLGRIEVGDGANVQDGCILHCFPGRETRVGEDGHIGHGAVLHGCTVGRGALVGINAVVMDDVEVGEFAFIGAHSFVRSGSLISASSLWTGSPASYQRDLTADELAWKANGTQIYQALARRCREGLREVDPLSDLDDDRPQLGIDASAAKPLHEFRGST